MFWDNVCAVNEHKNTTNKNIYYQCCRVNLEPNFFYLWFILGQTVTNVIIIKNGCINSMLRDDACALTGHKNTQYKRILHFQCCSVDLQVKRLHLWFSLVQTMIQVIIINIDHINYVYFYILTGIFRTNYIFSEDLSSYAI